MKLPISKLRNNTGQVDGVPANPRTISTDDYQKLIDSIKDDPEYLEHEMPHVIKHGDVYVVLNGNQRLRALKELGYKEVPVTIYPDDTPPDVIKARIIKSNHGYGKDDMDMLGNEWSDMPLDEWGIDLPDDWLEQEPEVEEDEAPAVDESEPPKSKLGEVYQLGRHRVMCGSAVDDRHLLKLLEGTTADMVYTDPPYGMHLDTDFSSMDGLSPDGKLFLGLKGGKAHERVAGDADDFDPDFIHKVFGTHPDCKEVFLWGADYYADILPGRNDGAWVVWDKRTNEGATEEQANSADKSLGSSFELCWSKAKHKREIARIRNGIFGVKNESGNSSTVHPTQKPVQLASWFFDKWGKPGDIIADHFLGSGSTLIACEQTDRTCYGMELDEKYVDVIRKRYAKFAAADDQLPENWEELTPAI